MQEVAMAPGKRKMTVACGVAKTRVRVRVGVRMRWG